MKRLILAVTAFLSFAGPVHSDPVHVLAGQQEGQGWAFVDASGCWAVTPRHVVGTNKGVIVTGAAGRVAQADRIVFPSTPGLDMAFLHLVGDLAKACPASGLGDTDQTPVLRRILAQKGELLALRQLPR
ncbi:MAG: hypothetical protein QM667_07775, partial [Asticcacaulis sp.]